MVATITITDRPGGITVAAESDPGVPVDDHNNAIVGELTDAQVAGALAAMTLDGSSASSGRRTLVHQGPS